MDKLAEMECFLRVVDSGGFSAAAASLHMTPSAVSKQIARLEDRLGARLLQRTTRRISLTHEGRGYYDQAREIVADIEAMEAGIGGAEREPRGLLRVNVAHGFGMAQIVPLIPDFCARYGQVEVQLKFSDRIVDLMAEGDDVGIRLGNLRDEGLVARRLGAHTRMICAAPAYLARHGTPLTPADLAEGHRAVLSTNVPLINNWPLVQPDGSVRMTMLPGVVSSDSGDALYRLVLAGLGIGYTADFLVHQAIRQGELVPILREYLAPQSWAIHAVYPARKHLAAKVRRFVDFLAERFTPQAPWQLG
ncbi:LysR family transcriptional regulator [Ferrovibrio sp.]|uniref:LysR family transcriptional regulator n=1 Tax=Ferrovibrio sp. TaxID=1917215 RepID=UPI001B53F584|nr:LysR family transcriptional regulator [Ferrovibrio sp.]MBP7062521.1 LysR family transcriptional regulator [Ferrovibrio sp.]